MIVQSRGLVAVAGLLLAVPAVAQQQMPPPTTLPDPATPTPQQAQGAPATAYPDNRAQPDTPPVPDARTDTRKHDDQMTEEGKAPKPETPLPQRQATPDGVSPGSGAATGAPGPG